MLTEESLENSLKWGQRSRDKGKGAQLPGKIAACWCAK